VTAVLLLAATLLMLPAMPLQRPRTVDRLNRVDVAAVLDRAHEEVFGERASAGRLQVAVAQLLLEGLALPGRNLGGLERVPGEPWVQVDAVTQLRAFDSHAEAARAYWRMLARICRGALAAFDYGSPEEIARRLYRCWWFRSSEQRYARGLRGLMGQREPSVAKPQRQGRVSPSQN